MILSKLKDNGQITLPVGIREQINAQKGDIFSFEIVDNQVIMNLQKLTSVGSKNSEKERKDLSNWIGSKPGVFKTAQEVDEFIRKERDLWD